MKRRVKTKVKGYETIDGAGVHLVRVLGNQTAEQFDPILMLDSFDSDNPDDYKEGFPMHPHRGIETISYISQGKMIHRDSLGYEDTISDGEVQWMNSGSGIMHEEQIPATDGKLLGVQLWLNLPSKEKMSTPTYKSIKKNEIKEFEIDGGKIKLLAGKLYNHQGHIGEHLPFDYYAIDLAPYATVEIAQGIEDSTMLFTLTGDISVEGELIEEKTAVKLTQGSSVVITNNDKHAQVLYMNSRALKEPIAWAGPIVMNSNQELEQAFEDIKQGSFIREQTSLENQ